MSDYEVTLVNDNMYFLFFHFGEILLTLQARILCPISWPT